MRVEIVREAAEAPEPDLPEMQASHIDGTTGENDFGEGSSNGAGPAAASAAALGTIAPEDRDPDNPDSWGKVGRNEACPCGSGKKYKHCHGAYS